MSRRSSSSQQQPQGSAQKEKQRRDRMKDLYSTLGALLHLHPSERLSLPALLDGATTSLKELKERVERLKEKKTELEKEVGDESMMMRGKTNEDGRVQQQQVVQVREWMESKLEANLIMRSANNNNNKKKMMLAFEVLRVIEEGGAEITSSTFCTVGNLIYCTVHAQAFQERVGFDAAEIQSQLLKLIQ